MVSVASNPDILIIGAGLAGAAAAEALAVRGFTVTVLEARDRVGGRGFSRPFANSDELLEFGGAWIRPWQVHIHDACSRHGVALRPRAPVTERRWFRDGALHKDGPASPEDLAQHERCVARIAADALSLSARGMSPTPQFSPAGVYASDGSDTWRIRSLEFFDFVSHP